MKKMKRMLATLLALIMLLGLGSISAFAAVQKPAADSVGIYELKVADAYKGKVTLKPQYKNGTDATAAYGFYENAEQVKVTYSAAEAGKYYMVFALTTAPAANGAAVPTQGNIMYLNQAEPTSTTAEFQVYPMTLTVGTTYYIYLSSNDAEGDVTSIQCIASFAYRTGEDVDTSYVLGDIDNDSYVTANDALYALQIAVNKTSLTIDGSSVEVTDAMRSAADTDKDSYVTANDALLILQKAVGKDVF